MRLHFFFSVIIGFFTTTLYAATEYSYDFLYDNCGYEDSQDCWLKVITDEDSGGLRCRARPSLRSSIIEVVLENHYVQAIDLAKSKKGRAFFKVSRNGQICYMRATYNRLSYSREYTHQFFHQQGCNYTPDGCLFAVITGEDNGGLRCRAKPSLRSSIMEVVPKNRRVLVIDFAFSDKGRTFFKVSRGEKNCYMRATQSRFSFIEKGKGYSVSTGKKNRTVPGNDIFITHLSFMNTRAGMPLESNIANLINQAVREGVQLAQQSMPHLKLNESGHQIDNSDENVNQFINLFFDFNLTKSEKITAIIQQMMIPNRVEVILTGQYVEKAGGIIQVRPFMLSKRHRRIVTRNFVFQQNDFICSYNALCQKAHQKIRDMVRELLGNF